MTNQEFLDAGYARFNPPPYEDCITDMYQKCIYDENRNKKYFITVERWDYTPVSNGRKIPVHYNFSVQFQYKLGGTVQMDCFSEGWTVEKVEEYFEYIFGTGIFEYYEMRECDDKEAEKTQEETSDDEQKIG